MLEGLPPHAPTHVLRIETDEASARRLTDLLGEVFDPAETAVAAFEIEPEDPKEGNATAQPWLLEAYFSREPNEGAIRDLLRLIVGEKADTAVFDAVAAKDWVKASLDGLKPVRAGRFLVHGGHDREVVKTNDIALEIEAALAFGTGHHGTTLGCLMALKDVLKQRRPRHVLDVGTGTGILGIAAAKALKARVVAGDIDPIAVEVARRNARLNAAAGHLDLYVAPGVRHALAARPERFDLVFANILARPLRRLAPSIAAVLAPGGLLVLSGLLPSDVPGVLSAYAAQGLRLMQKSQRDGWATLRLRKGGAAARKITRTQAKARPWL
ncbi:MAG: 50S ribosomal protein L11 methyltransferase [Chelatococcus sp.]|uniref:50S ribosomal protein L11 methyltransferase n=1 Tax=Chelatococcus sp. TaxID=1953771 RepID=UPI0025BA0F21|nr:50S ribosomal protein L11 methyltransferase [Chelatococcus sp.]MBX3538834.1 50S ribosomal protein L11 methyltransferase [Chelatococcus sp.]